MMRWYKITVHSPEALRNVRKSLKEQRLMVREVNGTLFSCISPNHQVWLHKVCGDFSAVLTALDEMPKGFRQPKREVYEAPCGEKFYDPLLFANHQRFCDKCRATRGERVKPTVAVIEPGQDFNLDGVIVSLEATKDKLYSQLETVESLLTNLKGYKDMEAQITSLGTEVKGRVDAVRILLRDSKIA